MAQVPDPRIQASAVLPSGVELQPGETLDAVYRGEVLLIQRRDGYRFSIDPLLLVAFAGRRTGRVVDLGTGCGIISLLAARRGAQSVVGVELQAPLYELAWRNVVLNRLEERVHLLNADLRQLRGVLPAGHFDLALSNPPYFPPQAGHVSPEPEKALARHELACSPPELAASARHLLKDGGSLLVVFPAQRLPALVASLVGQGLQPKRMRLVHPLASRPARLVLIEAIKGGGEGVLETMPPLVLHEESGGYSAEARCILSEINASFDERE